MKSLLLLLFAAVLLPAQNLKDMQFPVLQHEPGACQTDQTYRNATTGHVRICGPDNTFSDFWPTSTGAGISACSTTPPTTGTAHATCYDTAGTLQVCNNGTSACTTSGQWVGQGGGSYTLPTATNAVKGGVTMSTATSSVAVATDDTRLPALPLPEPSGGTGANNTTGAAGHVLRSNGSHYVDSAIQAGDLPAGTGTSVGASGAVQASNGSGLFADSGCTASGGVETCPNGFSSGPSGPALLQGTTSDNPTVALPSFYLDSTSGQGYVKNASSAVVGETVTGIADPSDTGYVNYIDAAGVQHRHALTLPSGSILGTTDVQTLTNKRITPRVVTCAASASTCLITGSAPNRTITFSSDSADVIYYNDADAAGTITVAADGGTPVDGQTLRIKLLTANAQTITWTLVTADGSAVALFTTTSGAGKIDNAGFIYDGVNSKWEAVAIARGY